MAGTPYQEFLNAVESYYGSGSDQWVEIAKYGTTAPNFEKIVKQLPNYNTVVSQSGKVLGYEKFDALNTSNVASNINSNLQTGANTALKVRTPATTGTDSVTSSVTASKGIQTSAGTQFITKSVVPAVAAAGVGISLGKTIDSALYNANPDFWDAHGMSSLNPDTWSDITADMSDTVGETALATAFNMLFGINPNTGKSQAYLDETAFAYSALYMQLQGMFTVGGEATIDDTTNFVYPTGQWNLPFKFASGTLIANFEDDFTVTVTLPSNAYGLWFAQPNVNYRADLILISDAPFTYNWAYSNGASGTDTVNARVTHNGISYYRSQLTMNRNFSILPAFNIWQRRGDNNPWDIGYTIYNGHVSGGLDGTGTQSGATLPQLQNNMSVTDALNALRLQYPDLWNNAVTYPVLQPDGTTTNYVYVPIALPNATSATDPQPTGDGQYINQINPSYDPNSMPSSVWEFIFDIIMDTSDYDDERPTDETGDGDTPTPIMPTGSASALWKIYNPSQAQLDAFGAWLWSSDFVDQILKLFNDPMQAIIGLHKVFVAPPTSGSGAIKVGYLTSTASANYVSSQYVDVDCGSVTLEEYFGNVFDYENTQVQLYLPFSGIHKLNIDDVMRGKIGVKYHVDVLTGACLIEVSIMRDATGGVLYTFSGNCAVQYPVSSGSYVGIITGLLGIAGGVAGSIATGGALTPMLMGAGASIGHMHTDVQHSGNISSNAGAMGIKKPYLIIERSQSKTPKNAVNIEGLPQNSIVELSSLNGYVKVKKAHYDGIPCTSEELEKIKALLENGVYIS